MSGALAQMTVGNQVFTGAGGMLIKEINCVQENPHLIGNCCFI